MPPKRTSKTSKTSKNEEEEEVEEEEVIEEEEIPKKTKKGKRTKKKKTPPSKEEEVEEEEGIVVNEDDEEAAVEEEEQEKVDEEEEEKEQEAEEEQSEEKPMSSKEYKKYLSKSWLLEIPEKYNEELGTNNDIYYDTSNPGTFVKLEDVIKLSKKETENLSDITDNSKKDNSVNKSIRKKLRAAGFDIIHKGFIIGNTDYIDSLRTAIDERRNIDSFKPKEPKHIVLKSKKEKKKKEKEEVEPIELPREEKKDESLDILYDRNVEDVIERINSASDENKVCIDIISAVESCPDTKKAIKEIKLSRENRIDNVKFTYPSKIKFEKDELEALALRYVGEYRSRQEDVKGKVITRKSKSKPSSSSDVGRKVHQSKDAPQRTVGGKKVSSIISSAPTITTPAIGKAD